ncbi:hypothetical protein [Amaricoccus solimangrovi]|uniref:Uncharacterized protein n=1 Tax=Amaricoccus solimangrovi TaxID=2589815 RepID=A0A501W8L8_9RHOB|nr:hypothetical protein [Amaricoccus solimangrovi]TPE45082.1 hypothetical protein FJM51_22805 [Amaricoccus solimangrovi]
MLADQIPEINSNMDKLKMFMKFNRYKWHFAIIALTFTNASHANARYFWQSDKSYAIQECEPVLKMRLKSPSSYKRIDVSDLERRRATLDEYMGWYSEKEKSRSKEISASDPDGYGDIISDKLDMFSKVMFDIVYIYIEYDAENLYGASIRSTAICSDIIPSGAEFDEFGIPGPSINGMTEIDWRIDRLR